MADFELCLPCYSFYCVFTESGNQECVYDAEIITTWFEGETAVHTTHSPFIVKL
jgi:hypothetical protein